MPALTITTMTYPATLELDWKRDPACPGRMLDASRASRFLQRILVDKAARLGGGTRRLFGEAYVATHLEYAHEEGYYSSFKWLTNPRFLSDRPFPAGPTQEFQQEYRCALHRHFGDQLEGLQRKAHALEGRTGVRPMPPDLWLIDRAGHHRFIEVKLPRDRVRESQLAGLAVIAASLLRRTSRVSVEVVELHPVPEPGTARGRADAGARTPRRGGRDSERLDRQFDRFLRHLHAVPASRHVPTPAPSRRTFAERSRSRRSAVAPPARG